MQCVQLQTILMIIRIMQIRGDRADIREKKRVKGVKACAGGIKRVCNTLTMSRQQELLQPCKDDRAEGRLRKRKKKDDDQLRDQPGPFSI